MASKAASELGKKGGSVKSEAKAAAARENAKKPRGKYVTAIAYKGVDTDGKHRFGVALARGRLNDTQELEAVCATEKNWEWVDLSMVVRVERLVL